MGRGRGGDRRHHRADRPLLGYGPYDRAWLAGLGLLPRLLPVRRGRLGGGARGLLGPLQTQHQLDQLVLAQTLKLAAPHPALESAKTPSLKGWVITPARDLHVRSTLLTAKTRA